jgi:F-type H+-transporting ATPase subunit b
MEFDLFTFLAQIVNFLILIVLLRVLLYKRIVRAMDEREKKIATDLQEAENKRSEAERESEAFLEKQRELDEQKGRIMAEAGEEAEERLRKMTEKARGDVEESKRRWHEALERERIGFLSELRRRAGQHTYDTVRRALKDLANDDLEKRMIGSFIERIRNLSSEEGRDFERFLEDSPEGVTLTSSFDMPDKAKRAILDTLKQRFSGELSVTFKTSPDLICGIEMKAASQKIGWSISEYLTGLEEELSAAVESEARRGR